MGDASIKNGIEGFLQSYSFRNILPKEEHSFIHPDIKETDTYICEYKPIIAYVGKKETRFRVYENRTPTTATYMVDLFTIPHTVTGLYRLHKIFDLLF